MSQFHELKYVPVKELVSQETVELFSQYALIDELFNFNPEIQQEPDAQVKNAHSKYADPFAESLLLHLKPKMEYVTELELIPTYSYYRVYRPGSVLKKHVDRPSCEISTSICFKYDYKERNEDLIWPIFFNNQPVVLYPGDGVVYKGMEVPHWREELNAPEFSYHIQAFFHYVNKNGPYVEYALDKRISIGQKKETNNKFKKSYLSTIN